MIWKVAASVPRIVHLEYESLWFKPCYRVRSDRAIDALDEEGNPAFFDSSSETTNEQPEPLGRRGGIHPRDRIKAFRTRSRIPSILLACHESYSVAAQCYTRAFGTLGASPEIWFNFDSDYLYVDWGGIRDPSYTADDILPEELARVRNLIIHQGARHLISSNPPYRGSYTTEDAMARLLIQFPNVEAVVVSCLDPAYPKVESGNLILMDPIPIETHAFYDFMGSFGRYDPKHGNAFNAWASRYLFKEPTKINVTEFKRSYAERLNVSTLPRWPQFSYKFITTPAMKERLVHDEWDE